MNFEFATAGRIIFGPGSSGRLAGLARQYGNTALFVSGRSTERTTALKKQLAAEQVDIVVLEVAGEPTTELVMRGTALAREKACSVIIAVGGGSVMDTGKAVAALCTNPGTLFDYLEIVGRGRPLEKKPLPCLAVPTTAGTGAEVTKNSVIASPEHRVKVSLRSQFMHPAMAIVDPLLTHSLSPAVTAASGLDALTQLIEAFVCNKGNPLTDGFCREGLKRAGRSLLKAYQDGADAEAREDISMAALLSGLALDNAKLGAVHGFAGALGGMISAPHGAICAALLPYVVEMNIATLAERDPVSDSCARFTEIARLLSGDPGAAMEKVPLWIKDLCSRLKAPSLDSLGLKQEQFAEAVAKAKNANSMKGNPVVLTDEELHGILARAWAANQTYRGTGVKKAIT